VCVIAWSAALTVPVDAVFESLFATRAQALAEAQAWAWHTVFWSFGFALVFQVGTTPYRWAGEEAEPPMDPLSTQGA
jgi:hypothetical protein